MLRVNSTPITPYDNGRYILVIMNTIQPLYSQMSHPITVTVGKSLEKSPSSFATISCKHNSSPLTSNGTPWIPIHTCIPYVHLHRVTYTRCRIYTIYFPDDEQMIARNM